MQLTRRGAEEDETTRPTKIPVPVSVQHSQQSSPRSFSAPAQPRAQPDESHEAAAKSLVRKSSFKLNRARSTSDLSRKLSVHWDTDLDTDEEKEEKKIIKTVTAAARTASRSSGATAWIDLGLSLVIGLANVVISGAYGVLSTLGRRLTIKNVVLMLLFCAGSFMLVDWLSANPIMHYIAVSVIRGAWMVVSSVAVSIFRSLMFKVPGTGDHNRSPPPPQQRATMQPIKTATAIPLPPMHVPRLFPAQDNHHHHRHLYGEDEQVGLTSVYGTAMLDLLGIWLPETLWWQGQSTLKDREVINSMRSKLEVATGKQGQMMMVTSQAAAYIHAETQAGGAVHTAWQELSELLAETRYLTSSSPSSSEYKVKMMLLGSCTIGDLGWQVQLDRATRLERAIKTLQGVVNNVVEMADKRKSVKNQNHKEAADTGRGVLHGPTQQVLRDILRHCEAASGLLAGKEKSAALDRAMEIELGAGRSTAKEMGLSWQLSMQDECREMLALWNGMAGLEETLVSLQPPPVMQTQTQTRRASVHAMVVGLASGLEDARTRGLVEGPWWRVWWRVLSGCRPHHDNGDIADGNGRSWQQASVNDTRWAEIKATDQRLLQWTEKLMAALRQALRAGETGK